MYKHFLQIKKTHNRILLYWDYVLYPIWEAGVNCPPLFTIVAHFCALSSNVGTTS